MTEEQFDTIMAGTTIAHTEGLHRLGELLSAAMSVAETPSEEHLAALTDWATKVAGDLVSHRRKNPV